MLIAVLSSLLLASPYPFEVKSGFVLEPTLGYLFRDSTNDSRLTGGARLSYLYPDVSDALISAEIQFLSATSFGMPKDALGQEKLVTDTNYFFEAGFVFTEIYNPMAFRLAAGGGLELSPDASPDVYYRAGLGGYFSENIGLFIDGGGRIIFRSNKVVYPIEIGPSLQFIF